MDGTAMLIHNHRMRDGQSLSGPLPDLLRSEEGIKNPGPDILRDPRSGVAHPDLRPVPILACAHGDSSLPLRSISYHIRNGMGRVDNHIQNHLVELSRQAVYQWQGWIEVGN